MMDGNAPCGWLGRILSSIPQYQNVAWQLDPMLCESDDFFYSLYRRNWHHVEVEKLTPEDWEFINELGRKYGPNGVLEPLPHWSDMSINERHEESLFQERCAELTEYVELLLRNTPELDLKTKPRDWVAQFVNKKQVRLANDRPSDLFASQDGMGEVEALVREKLRELLP